MCACESILLTRGAVRFAHLSPCSGGALKEAPHLIKTRESFITSEEHELALEAELRSQATLGLEKALHAEPEPWRLAAERWKLYSDSFVGERGSKSQYTVTGTLVFAHEPGGSERKTIFEVIEAADKAQQGRKGVVIKHGESCPNCAPNACSKECAWAMQRVRAVEFPFTKPSWWRRVLIWTLLVLAFAAGIFATIYYSIAGPGTRQPAVSGCGAEGGEAQVRLQMIGLSRKDLRALCAEIRTSIAEACDVTPDKVVLLNLKDVRRSLARTVGLHTSAGGYAHSDRRAASDAAVEFTCSFLSDESTNVTAGGGTLRKAPRYARLPVQAAEAHRNTATNTHTHRQSGNRARGSYRSGAAARLNGWRRDALGALEESITSGALDQAILLDWGVTVESVFLGIPEAGTTDKISADGQQGGAVALVCPEHSSAPAGALSIDLCTCNPGYYKASDSLLSCLLLL